MATHNIGGDHTDDDADSVRLSEPAKRLIQAFMWKKVVPTGIGLSVLTAALGFLINEWARGEAYVKAYGDASKSIVDTATTAGKAAGQIDSILAAVTRSNEEIKNLNKIVNDQVNEVKKAKSQADEITTANYDDISKALLQNDNFKSSLARNDQIELGKFDKRLNGLAAELDQMNQNLKQQAADLRALRTAAWTRVAVAPGKWDTSCEYRYQITGQPIPPYAVNGQMWYPEFVSETAIRNWFYGASNVVFPQDPTKLVGDRVTTTIELQTRCPASVLVTPH